ncbi:MAG: diguanylate cyclase domain-containing protein, partial [Halothiobacillus sp.]
MPSTTINLTKPSLIRDKIRQVLIAFVLPLTALLSWMAWVEQAQWREARQEVFQTVARAAQAYANEIQLRLNAQFVELQFTAIALLRTDANPANPTPQTIHTLHLFMRLHPALYAFNIQSPDGNQILWSTNPQSAQPITPGAAFTPLALYPDYLLGQAQYAPRVGSNVLTMRYRFRDDTGAVRFLVGTPYRLDKLLALAPEQIADLAGFVLEVQDQRTQQLLGRWQDGQWAILPAADSLPRPADGVVLPVPGYPFTVSVQGMGSKIWAQYRTQGVYRWLAELLTLIVMAILLGGLITLVQRRQRDAERLRRLADFNALLAAVNQTLTTPLNQDELLQAICRLAVQHLHLQLAMVAQPNAEGWFEWRAAVGDTGYLEGLMISTDAHRLEGQGPMGRAWRTGEPQFVQDLSQSLTHQPWVDRLKAHQFKAAAALPITLMGQPFGVLSIYHARSFAFDAELRQILIALAATTSRGLEIVQARINEAALAAELMAERESAEYRAVHDALTGLPNRAALMQHLTQAIARARRQGSALAVGMLDLDDFKPINDQLGHAAGDELLRLVTHRLRAQLRETDFLARLGGDEFVLVFEDLLLEQAPMQLKLMLERFHTVMAPPFILEGAHEVAIGLSLGLALYPQAGIDADQLLRQADAAMYAIKAQKHQRATWWQLSDEIAPAPAVPSAFSAFNAQAMAGLTRIQPLLVQVADLFIDQFYEGMALDPEVAAILATLGDDELVHLKAQQKAHLLFLLQPQ